MHALLPTHRLVVDGNVEPVVAAVLDNEAGHSGKVLVGELDLLEVALDARRRNTLGNHTVATLAAPSNEHLARSGVELEEERM